EAVRAPVARTIDDLPAMPARDLPHQRKTEADATRSRTGRHPVERRKQIFAVRLGDPGTTIADAEHGVALMASRLDLDRRHAMPFGVLDQVADQPAQQARVAAHGHRLARERAELVTCAL